MPPHGPWNTPGALGEIRGDVHIHELEVTGRARQRALGAALAGEAIDILIHNAGVYGAWMRAADDILGAGDRVSGPRCAPHPEPATLARSSSVTH